MNGFFRAPLVAPLFSKAAQHGLTPFVACSQGRGLSGFMMSLTRNYFVVASPYQPLPAVRCGPCYTSSAKDNFSLCIEL